MKSRTHANRGKLLEHYIHIANATYAQRGKAVIIKQHPEVTVTGTAEKKITSGFYKAKGAPDYIGLAGGVGICFDAKETKENSLPMKNISHHQICYMRQWQQQGGISFILVHFKSHAATYILPLQLIEEALANDSKSISLEEAKSGGRIVSAGSGITIDWLSAVLKLFP